MRASRTLSAAFGAVVAAHFPIFAALGAPAGLGPPRPAVMQVHGPAGEGPMGGVWRPGHRGGAPGRRPFGGVMPAVPIIPLLASTPEISATAVPMNGPACLPAMQIASAASLPAGPKIIEIGVQRRWRAHWPVVIYGDPTP